MDRNSRYSRALELVAAIHRDPTTAARAVELMAEFLLGIPGTDTVVASDNTAPERPGPGWVALGSLGWLKHWFAGWQHPGLRLGPLRDDEPDPPLHLPKISVWAEHGPCVLIDVAALDEPAPVDHASLTARGVRAYALVTARGSGRNGVSLCLVSAVPQPEWEQELPQLLSMFGRSLSAVLERDFLLEATGQALRTSQEAARRQRAFFAAVGHHLRTPAAEIVAAAEAAQVRAQALVAGAGELSTEQVREHGQEIDTNSQDILEAGSALASMISKLLTVAQPVNDDRAQVLPAVQDALTWCRTHAAVTGVDLRLVTPEGDQGPTWAGQVHAAGFTGHALRLVVRELVSQVVAVTAPDGQVEVSVDPAAGPPGWLLVRVASSGPVLTAEQGAALLSPPADASLGTTPLQLVYVTALVEKAGARMLVGAGGAGAKVSLFARVAATGVPPAVPTPREPGELVHPGPLERVDLPD